MRQRLRESLLTAAALGAIFLLLAACATAAPGPPPLAPLVGTQLKGDPATDFRLLDERGAAVALSDLRGKPVVLTFQYTYCPDSLPRLMAAFLFAHAGLGEQARNVAFWFVSVDPERDSVERTREYLAGQGALGKVSFLTGSRADLEPLWKAYYLSVTRLPIRPNSEEARRYGGYAIGHTEVIYLIDKAGRLRCLMRPDLDPADLLRNVQTLLREP